MDFLVIEPGKKSAQVPGAFEIVSAVAGRVDQQDILAAKFLHGFDEFAHGAGGGEAGPENSGEAAQLLMGGHAIGVHRNDPHRDAAGEKFLNRDFGERGGLAGAGRSSENYDPVGVLFLDFDRRRNP